MKMTAPQTLRIVSVVILVIAVLSLPYAYYTFLRLVVCITAIFSAYEARNRGDQWMIVFILIGILFNPIVPIYLSRTIWQITDIGVAGTLLYYKGDLG